MSDVGDDVVAVPEVRGEHAVVSGEVGAWAWDQRGKPGNEVEGVEDDVSGPVTEGVLESVDDLANAAPPVEAGSSIGQCSRFTMRAALNSNFSAMFAPRRLRLLSQPRRVATMNSRRNGYST